MYFANLDREDIDNTVNTITDALVKSFEESCPLRERKSPYEKPWMTGEIRSMGKEVRRLYNRAKRKKAVVYWEDYREKLRDYNKRIRIAKRASWRLFCEQVDTVSDMSKIKKFLSKTHIQAESLVDESGRRIENMEESFKLLMDTHFPGNQAEPTARLDREANGGYEVPVINGRMVKEAIKSFSPFKAAGPDGIFPALLQKGSDILSPHLARIFNACLIHTYMPRNWQEARVVFIPKPGKASYASPKAYRPISLTSFLLKTMERIIDDMVKSRIADDMLRFRQHAYVKGRSVDTALHNVVHFIERSLEEKMYTLAVCIDIEGAFNNVYTDTLIQSMDQFQVNGAIRNWIDNMLRNRWIRCGSHNIEIRRKVNCGTPQGGILSPLLWTTTIHSLIRILTDEGLETICYADDVIILLKGRNLHQLCRRAEEALKVAYDWAQPRGLNVNPDKTEIGLFTRRTKMPSYDGPRFQGRTINLSDRVKYLGVILDRKLKWKHHIEERVKKAHICWSICKRAIGLKWGLNPEMAHWLYGGVIRPIMTYASVVWWTSMEYGCNIKVIQRVQRTCCLGISGAFKTTPTRAMETILSVEPIEIRIKYEAALTAKRLQVMGEWIEQGHAVHHQRITEVFDELAPDNATSDRIPEGRLGVGCETLIPDLHSWLANPQSQIPMGPCCYTDGSRARGRTGIGVYMENTGTELSFRLPDYSTVLQAEVKAITECIRMLSGMEGIGTVNIFTDSQNAIRAISSERVKSRTVWDCKNAINSYSTQGGLSIIWVPGHAGVSGNEWANSLASRAREQRDISLDCAKPFEAVKADLKQWAKRAHKVLWNNESVGLTTRILWGDPDGHKTRSLLRLSKPELSRMMGVMTGHSELLAHLHRIGIAAGDECRACREDRETLEHYLCQCPAFSQIRSHHFGSDTLQDITCLGDIGWRKLRDFVLGTEFL